MVYTQQKIGEVALNYFNTQSDSDFRWEVGKLNSYINNAEGTDWINIDEKSNIILNKLTDNLFIESLLMGISSYLDKNAAITFVQNYDSIRSSISNGQVEISIFTQHDDVYLEKIKIENPIYGGLAIESFLIMNEVNRNFLYNPDLFIDTLPGRIFTGDNLLRYTSDCIIPVKVKVRLNDDRKLAISGYKMPIKYDGDSFVYNNTISIDKEPYSISLNLLNSTLNWFDLV